MIGFLHTWNFLVFPNLVSIIIAQCQEQPCFRLAQSVKGERANLRTKNVESEATTEAQVTIGTACIPC